MLKVQGVSYRVGRHYLVRDVSLTVEVGTFVAIVGANGAGKTTLLKLMAGDLFPESGMILLNDKPLKSYTMRELALQRAVMPQQISIAFDFSVYDVVMMGRYPHSRTSQAKDDRAIVETMLVRTQTENLRDQAFATLSGGEQARVTLARVLAQQTPLLLLDEPTSALDLRHQQLALTIAREWVNDGHTVIAILHDLNLAALYADRIVMMAEGQLRYQGTPREVLIPSLIEEIFKIPVQVHEHPQQTVPLIIPLRDNPHS